MSSHANGSVIVRERRPLSTDGTGLRYAYGFGYELAQGKFGHGFGETNPLGRRVTSAVVQAEVDIARTPNDVFDYCSDPSNEPEWNPMMKRIVKLTDGPLAVGTRYETEFAQGPRMVMACVRYERPSEWSLTGKSRSLKAGGGGRVVPTAEGSRLVMWMELELAGLLKLGTPLLRRRMQAMFQRDVENIKTRLEANQGARLE